MYTFGQYFKMYYYIVIVKPNQLREAYNSCKKLWNNGEIEISVTVQTKNVLIKINVLSSLFIRQFTLTKKSIISITMIFETISNGLKFFFKTNQQTEGKNCSKEPAII